LAKECGEAKRTLREAKGRARCSESEAKETKATGAKC
jgi:hypothetical protein